MAKVALMELPCFVLSVRDLTESSSHLIRDSLGYVGSLEKVGHGNYHSVAFMPRAVAVMPKSNRGKIKPSILFLKFETSH